MRNRVGSRRISLSSGDTYALKQTVILFINEKKNAKVRDRWHWHYYYVYVWVAQHFTIRNAYQWHSPGEGFCSLIPICVRSCRNTFFPPYILLSTSLLPPAIDSWPFPRSCKYMFLILLVYSTSGQWRGRTNVPSIDKKPSPHLYIRTSPTLRWTWSSEVAILLRT